MAKKGIKVKELAANLGITSRQLIDRCRCEGIPVQNSITKFPPQVERVIRAWFTPETQKRPDTAEESSGGEP